MAKENINFETNNLKKSKNTIIESDFILINDGWINRLNFQNFREINEKFLLEKLDKRSKNFLYTFEEGQRNKLFPIGVVPYAVIIKNNKDLINQASLSWDFLLSQRLTNKIIFPESPRILVSISKKISGSNTLAQLKKQAMLLDDKNSLNWLIKSEACVAIIPFSLALKYLKIDSRLSIVFPRQGVPLMWYFVLNRSSSNSQLLFDWLQSLEKKSIVDKLSSQG